MAVDANLCTCESLQVGIRSAAAAAAGQRRQQGSSGICGRCVVVCGGVVRVCGEGGVLLVVWCVMV